MYYVSVLVKVKPCGLTYFLWLYLFTMFVNYVMVTVLSGHEKHDKEGRVITAEYEKFYFVTACEYYYRRPPIQLSSHSAIDRFIYLWTEVSFSHSLIELSNTGT